MDKFISDRAKQWTSPSFDQETRNAVSHMIANDPDELVECFHQELEFGTGGLRGIMGVGTNRMNVYTVGYASQGLANYVKENFEGGSDPAIAIAYDSRNNSKRFAKRAAEIFAANGIDVKLFRELRPTPLLSFAVRELGCQAGVVITASHNPKEYSGYKVYWSDGGQLVPPHDNGVIQKVREVRSPEDVKSEGGSGKIEMLGEELDTAYLEKSLNLLELAVDEPMKSELKVCYTSIHGTGITLIPKALEAAGYQHVTTVGQQDDPNGDFPTVVSPNPEEQAAMAMGLELAEKTKADVLFGTDPDTDRVGMAIRNDSGKLVLLNGNEAASLLVEFLLCNREDKHGCYIAKTIVTTDLLTEMAKAHGVECHETLTGFKYIAELIGKLQGKTFIGGGEESYGYLIGDVVRDKDAVISTVMLTEMCTWAMKNGWTPFDFLKKIRAQYGFYKEGLVSVVKKGISGAAEIKKMIEDMRSQAPEVIGGQRVTAFADYSSGKKRLSDGTLEEIDLPKSNVLQFFLEDGSKVTVRPSGTEPKIKFYISVRSELQSVEQHDVIEAQLLNKIESIKKDLGIQA